MNFKNLLAKYYINSRGWKTPRKIVVIESDDWGSIRMPSKEVVFALIKKGYTLEKNKFTSLDGLETTADLEELFNVLENHKNKEENHPVITACAIVANPDFKKIRDSNFTNYHYETIAETYKRYNEDQLIKLWKERGIKDNLLYLQFHGREHLNPHKWLKVLRDKNQMELDAFDTQSLLGLSEGLTKTKDMYMAAFEATSEEHKDDIKSITKEGLDLFEDTFGFKSVSYIPSQSKQFEEINETLVKNGVKFSQAGQYFVPHKDGSFRKVDKIWGEKDQYGMRYWRRNCSFEPYKSENYNIENCLKEIDIAFRCGKPAVISSHRINFTSRIDKNHRDRSLELLDALLSKIIKKHPEVEFLNSEQLANEIIASSQNK
ncbi:hypothetical protein [Psychroflexus montanilacus]|uniref:hypothetical protein n=1 Tax=Psychroflexus montanilacus TaxID=2873598 RepID=UPI001CCA793C|nr:hypothetical protein [Psychroflexus montanilacus]MBZ9652571.1 hypothetical protein [Psychroflexus montanilacus]